MGLRTLVPAVVFLVVSAASAQLMIPDSGAGDRIMLFNSFDGTVMDPNWLTDVGAVGWSFSTPKEALRVGNEIWVSDQVADAMHRFDMAHNFLGSVTAHASGSGTLDNIRGIGTDGTKVYASVFPSTVANRGVAIYDITGAPLGFMPIAMSLFDSEPYETSNLLIANEGPDNIERWVAGGGFINNFATNIVFPQQILVQPDQSVITVASISSPGNEGVWHFNADGSLRRYIQTDDAKPVHGELVPRGAYLLGDGNYLIATSTGILKYDVGANTYAMMLDGVDGQYINLVPEPATLVMLGIGAALLRRRQT